jgi:hypothetical protein
MKPLTTTSSVHFVAGFQQDPSLARLGVQDYLNRDGSKQFNEGTPSFDGLRVCLLQEAEQYILLAQSCYSHGLEGLRSMVSFYYSAFFATKAILGTYGCWMAGPRRWIEVLDSTPGSIKLVYRMTSFPTQVSGSHRVAWAAYYKVMSALSNFLTSPDAVVAKTPVHSQESWLIDTRNDVNYEPQSAFKIGSEFESSFTPTAIPSSLRGRLSTMLQVSRSCNVLAKENAVRVGLSTGICSPEPTRIAWVQNRVMAPQHPLLLAYRHAEMASLAF